MAQATHAITATATLPASPFPVALRVGNAFVPAICHPGRTVPHLRFARFPRKAKATTAEALTYAYRALWYRENRAAEKRRRLEILSSPHWVELADRAA